MNMRTSPIQFEVMVKFMERHGDLNKPGTNNCESRVDLHKRWQELTNHLNMLDPSGFKRTTDKWKKVWSDLKNNTKRKAGKICHAKKLGGDQHRNLVLTDLEKRVLRLTKWKHLGNAGHNDVSQEVTSPDPVLDNVLDLQLDSVTDTDHILEDNDDSTPFEEVVMVQANDHDSDSKKLLHKLLQLNSNDSPKNEKQDELSSDEWESDPLSDVEDNTKKTRKRKKTTKINDIEAKMIKFMNTYSRNESENNRHKSFFNGIMPTLDSLDENEVLEFQTGVLQLLTKIKNNRNES